MPRRRRLNRARVIAQAAALADEAGDARAVSLAALAAALDVRPPSLYNHVAGLDDLLEAVALRGLQALLTDLNALYRKTPALHQVDFDGSGFEWIDWNDRDNSVLSWIRRDSSGGYVVCVTNLTPIVRNDYLLGVPSGGKFDVLLNTDEQKYGGSGVGPHSVTADDHGHLGRPNSLRLALPPLATMILQPAPQGD